MVEILIKFHVNRLNKFIMMNYIRYIELIVFIVFSLHKVYAVQFVSDKPTIDQSRVECIYCHNIYDADLDNSRNYLAILQIGDKFVQFMNYGTYRVDSILSFYNIEDVPNSFYEQLLMKYPTYYREHAYLIDKSNKTIYYGNQVPFSGAYFYKDQLTKIKWMLHDEEKMILGYKCRKATACYKGRNWTVWYAPEIRYGYGPGPLRDLPGLVLEAYDDSNAHHFEAVAIRKKSNPILKEMRFVDGIELERKKFLEFDKDKTLHSSDGAWQSYYEDPANHPKPAFKHFHYAPYELE